MEAYSRNIETQAPVLFVGHGSPLNAIEDSRARTGWADMGKQLGKPSVILAVSAHWAARETLVSASESNRQIFDMTGFPKELYEVKYAPAGSPEFARKALNLLGDTAREDHSWGIDHGIWSILTNMYPEANVPVVMISTNTSASPEQLFEIGKRLQPLRREGAMILASGNVVHNLRLVDWSMSGGYAWADAFDRTIRDAVADGCISVPLEYQTIPGYRQSVPTPEHYDPLLVTLGAVSDTDTVTVWNEYRELGSMSMTSYLWK